MRARLAPANLRVRKPVGTFHVSCTVANITDRRKTATVPKALVDTGSEYTWIDSAALERIGVKREKKDMEFVMANGQRITRSLGFAVIHAGGTFTVDEVVFGEPGDLALLGARTLEGLNLAVDPAKKRLVAAGPRPAAAGRNGPPRAAPRANQPSPKGR